MKKMKLFLTGMLAACVAVGGANAAETQTFERCVADSTKAVCELSENYKLNADLLVSRKLTINLKGHTLDFDTHRIKVLKNGDLTIEGENGKIDAAKTPAATTRLFVSAGSNLTVDNVTIDAIETSSDNQNSAVIVAVADNVDPINLVIGKGTVINSTDTAVSVDTSTGGQAVIANVNVTISGTIKTTENLAVTVKGTVKEGAYPTKVTVTGDADITSEEAPGVYAAGYGVWTFEDGAKVTGYDAISIKSGEVTINGGEYYANGRLVIDPAPNGNGPELTGSVVSVTPHATGYAGNIKVTINGGKFEAKYGLDLLETTRDTNTTLIGLEINDGEFICGETAGVPVELKKAKLTKFIKGGTFTGDHKPFNINADYVVGDTEVVDGVIYTGDSIDTLHNVKVALVQPDGQTVNVAGAYRVAAGNKIILTNLFGFDMTRYADYTITYVVKDAEGTELARIAASRLKGEGEDAEYVTTLDEGFTMIDGDVTVEIIFSKDGMVVAPDEPVIPDPDDDKPAESTPGTGSETEEKPEGNPNTLDSLPLYLIGGAVAVLGVAGLGYSIKKKFEN